MEHKEVKMVSETKIELGLLPSSEREKLANLRGVTEITPPKKSKNNEEEGNPKGHGGHQWAQSLFAESAQN